MKILEVYPKDKTADTLCIFKRTKSKYWYVRFYVSKSFNKSGLFHQSTKCTEKEKHGKEQKKFIDTLIFQNMKCQQKL